jgi:hypothetical protein
LRGSLANHTRNGLVFMTGGTISVIRQMAKRNYMKMLHFSLEQVRVHRSTYGLVRPHGRMRVFQLLLIRHTLEF